MPPSNRYVSIVLALIAAGADVNARYTNSGWSALHYAAWHGNVSIVLALIAAGADVNVKNSSGKTPLHLAADNRGSISPLSRYVSIVSALVAAGGHWGEACAGGNAVNPAGPNPPCVAAAVCASPSVLNAGTNRCDCPAPSFGSDGADPPGHCHAENALHLAAGTGDLVSVGYLIAVHMADVNATTSAGETPLHNAARNGHVSIVAALIAAGADVNVTTSAGETPLRVSDADAAALLIAAGGHWGTACVNENVVNPAGYSPPCVAAAVCAAPSVLNAETNRCDCPAPSFGADGADPPGHCHAENALLDAASAGDLDVVNHLITVHMADVHVTSSVGHTPLHNAAVSGHVSVVSALLAAGADVNATTSAGETPLRVSHADAAALLIAAGGHWGEVCAGAAVVNPAGPSPSCLCESPNVETDSGACEAVAACAAPSVLNAGTNRCDCPAPHIGADGADPPGDCHGANALHLAAGTGDLVSVGYLITVHMADVDAKDAYGYTPQHYAAWTGHVSVVAALIAAGADVNVKDNDGRTPLYFAGHAAVISTLLAAGADANEKDDDGRTPLHFAGSLERFFIVIAAGADVVAPLIAGGANVDEKDDAGEAPLHIAARNGRVSIVAALITGGASVNEKNDAGETPLHIAVGEGRAAVVAALLAAGAAVNEKNDAGEAPLDIAVSEGRFSIASALLAAGATSAGRTPLHTAASNGDVSVVVTLLAAGADANATISGGATPLHYAAGNGHVPVVSTLIAAGATVNVKDDEGETPLHYGARHGGGAVVAALLAAGADADEKSGVGETPLHIAGGAAVVSPETASVLRRGRM